MNNKFAGIQEFVATVDHGSFTAAADVLGVSGSAIGKSISKLEKRLGVQLLHRTTRKIVLTAQGEAWLVSCRRILEELEYVEAALSAENEAPMGRIRIDLPTTFGRRYILPKLQEIALNYPKLNLSIMFQDKTIDMINEGVDLVLRIGEIENYGDLVAKRIGYQKLILCASPDYLLRHGFPENKEDLQNHYTLVGLLKHQQAVWLLKNQQGEAENYEIKYKHELTDGDALLSSCLAGCGLALLPNWLVYESLQSKELISVLPELSGVQVPMYLIWQKRWYQQAKVRLLVDELMQFAHSRPELFQ